MLRAPVVVTCGAPLPYLVYFDRVCTYTVAAPAAPSPTARELLPLRWGALEPGATASVDPAAEAGSLQREAGSLRRAAGSLPPMGAPRCASLG
jgi:hypothetical protein